MGKIVQPIVLTIAGSDNTAGAGIQADLKTCHNIGVYCATIVTSVTAQNKNGLHDSLTIPIDLIEKQFTTIYKDFNISALKIGMLPSSETIKAVARLIKKYSLKNIILDPVMRTSANNNELMKLDAIKDLKKYLLPIVDLITPNIDELSILTDINDIYDTKTMVIAGKKLISEYNCPNILLKGGHLPGNEATDILLTSSSIEYYKEDKIISTNYYVNHGTGCRLSSAIMAYIAKGQGLKQAIKSAKNYLIKQLKQNYIL